MALGLGWMRALRRGLLVVAGLVALVACRTGSRSTAPSTIPAPPATAPDPRTTARRPADLPLPAGALRRLGGAQLRQSGGIKHVVPSPDGRFVATGGDDGSLRVWRAEDGAELHASFVQGHVYGVMGLAFRPGADQLLAAVVRGAPGSVRVISTTTWEASGDLPLRCGLTAMAVSPDGGTLAVACPDALWLHPLGGGEPRPVPTIAGPEALSWSGDGALLAVGRRGGIDVVDAARGAVVETISREHLVMTHVAFAPTGGLLAYADFHGGATRVHDVAQRREVAAYPTSLGARALSWNRSGESLAIAHDDSPSRVEVITVASGERRPLHPPNGMIRALAFAPGGELWIGTDHALRAWDPTSDAEILGPEGHSSAIRALAFQPGGRVLASGADDGTIRLWDLVRGGHRVLERREGGGAWRGDDPGMAGLVQQEVVGLAFLDHDHLLAADGARWTGVLRVWSTEHARVVGGSRVHDEGVAGLALAPDGRTTYVIGREDEESPLVPPDPFLTSLRVVDPASLTTRSVLPVGDGSHTLPSEGAVAVSRDGARVAVRTDEVVEIRDAVTGAILRTFDGAESHVAMAPGGDLAAVSTGPVVDVWAADEPEPRVGWSLGGDHRVTALAFSHDGRSIAAGDSGGGVFVIDVATPDEPRATWTGHRGPVTTIVFAPEGRTFVTAGADGQILVWPLAP